MNGTQIATVALVALLAFPAVAAGYSNDAPVATDPPRTEFAAMADGEGAIGQSGVIAQQSDPTANGTIAANESGTTADGPTTASGQTVSPDVDFEVVNIDSSLEPGEQGTIEVTIENQGEDAEDAVVNLQSQSSGLVFGESASASQFVGEWDEGENRTVEVEATVPSGGDDRSYPVQATVSYADGDGNQSQSAPLTFGVTASEDEEDFTIVSTSSDVSVGSTGNLTVVLENQGGDVEDAAVSLGTLSGSLTFGEAANTTQFVGDWADGERKTVEVEVSAAPSAKERSYALQATVVSEDDGQQARAGPYRFGVTPAGAQEFTLDGVDSSLTVGEEGMVSGTITNEGPKNATDATVVFAANATGAIAPRQSEVVLDDLEPNESIDFEYPFAINSTAEPGEQQLPFVVQYQNADGETLRSTRLNAQVTIGERTDEFTLETVASNVQVGDTGTVTLTLGNTGSADREDASVTLESTNAQVLFGNSTSATRYVGQWGANETETVSFQTTATPDASVEDYALTAQVTYRNDDGQPVSSQQLSMGITPLDEQTFAIDEANTTLRIGRDGYINGTITNTGPLPAGNATVQLGNLSGITSERVAYPVGGLDVGENETFSFPVSVMGGATGPQQVEYSVSYTGPTDNDDRRTATGLMGEVAVAPREPLLTANVETPNVTVGESELMNVSVTNNGDETLRNIQLVPNGSGSLQLSPTSLFVSDLEPGETATRQLEVDAEDVDNPSRIPLIIDFQYETTSNEVRQAQAPPVGIDVVAAESGLITGPIVVGAVLVIVVLGGLIWYLR